MLVNFMPFWYFYGHLVYFVSIWYTYFPGRPLDLLWYVVPRKIWQPWFRHKMLILLDISTIH
jgi:hypothetical protein